MIIANLIRVLMLIFLFILSINAQSLLKSSSDSLSYFLNNYEFEKFNFTIEKSKINKHEKEFYILKKNFVMYLLNSELGESKSFFNKLTQFRKKLNNDNTNENIKNQYYLATSKTLEIITYIVENEHEKAFSIAKKNYKEFKNFVNNGIDDAYFDLALHIVFFNKISEKKSFVISLFGLENDLELAKNYLNNAIKKGKFYKTEAVLLLSEILKMQNLKLKTAENYLYELYQCYPKNALFIYNYSVLLMKTGNYKKAKKVLDENSKLFEQYKTLRPYFNFIMGDIYLILEEYENAISCFSNFSENLKDNSYIGEANYKIAISKLLIGKINESRRYLSKTSLGNVDLESDVFFRQRASKIIENITNKLTIDLFYIEILLLNNNFQEAEKKLKSIKIDQREHYSLLLILRAKINIYLNKNHQAYNLLNELINKKSKDNFELKTEAAILLSELKYKNNKKREALYFLEQAENYNVSYFKENYKKRIDYLKIMLKN